MQDRTMSKHHTGYDIYISNPHEYGTLWVGHCPPKWEFDYDLIKLAASQIIISLFHAGHISFNWIEIINNDDFEVHKESTWQNEYPREVSKVPRGSVA